MFGHMAERKGYPGNDLFRSCLDEEESVQDIHSLA